MEMRHLSLKLAASLLVFTTAAGPAAADDRKHYPGAACLVTGSSSTSIERSDTLGRAYNVSTTTKMFVCPAVKDYVSITSGYAYVYDKNPGSGQSVSCSLRAGRPSSLYMTFSSGETDPPGGTFSSTEEVRLDFGPVSALTEGFYFLQCSVPAIHSVGASGVLTYSINEQE
jgi:hypothetical protein